MMSIPITRHIGFLNQPIHITNAHGKNLKVVFRTAGAVDMRSWNIDFQTFVF
jgi:hypothetical protein